MGLVILFARISSNRLLQTLTTAYIEVFQGTPLLMPLFIVFFGFSLVGLEISPWIAAALGLTLFTSAYLAEIWRGCVESIPRGQWEASASLALSYAAQMRHVILPQALRIAIAPTVGFSVQVVKGTAAICCSDEFFAPLARMLNPEPAVFVPGKYDDNGKWLDGWETRRKRACGHDWGILKLGRRGRVTGLDVDTSHFTGN